MESRDNRSLSLSLCLPKKYLNHKQWNVCSRIWAMCSKLSFDIHTNRRRAKCDKRKWWVLRVKSQYSTQHDNVDAEVYVCVWRWLWMDGKSSSSSVFRCSISLFLFLIYIFLVLVVYAKHARNPKAPRHCRWSRLTHLQRWRWRRRRWQTVVERTRFTTDHSPSTTASTTHAYTQHDIDECGEKEMKTTNRYEFAEWCSRNRNRPKSPTLKIDDVKGAHGTSNTPIHRTSCSLDSVCVCVCAYLSTEMDKMHIDTLSESQREREGRICTKHRILSFIK